MEEQTDTRSLKSLEEIHNWYIERFNRKFVADQFVPTELRPEYEALWWVITELEEAIIAKLDHEINNG